MSKRELSSRVLRMHCPVVGTEATGHAFHWLEAARSGTSGASLASETIARTAPCIQHRRTLCIGRTSQEAEGPARYVRRRGDLPDAPISQSDVVAMTASTNSGQLSTALMSACTATHVLPDRYLDFQSARDFCTCATPCP